MSTDIILAIISFGISFVLIKWSVPISRLFIELVTIGDKKMSYGIVRIGSILAGLGWLVLAILIIVKP